MKKVIYLSCMLIFLFSCRKIEENAFSSPDLASQNDKFILEGIKGLDFETLDTGTGTYRGRKYTFYIYGNSAIIENDLLIPLSEIELGDQPQPSKSVSPSNSSLFWPKNEVFYRFNSALTTTQRNMIISAITHWQANTNLRFIQNSSAPNVVEFQNFNTNSTYSSSVGRATGVQVINLATWATTGNVIHEIGHAVGLFHEHTRADRNSFVTVNFGNIQSGAVHNFQIPANQFASLGGLDFNSIMMYPSFTGFEINPSIPSITRINGTTFTAQRTALSQTDISGTTLAMYPKRAAAINDISQGSGSAIGDINGNGIPDLILMANDNPPGTNQFRYRILYDLDNLGNPSSTSGPIGIAGVGDNSNGASCALADINNNGKLDLILMVDDDLSGLNQFRYKIAYDLNTAGIAASVSSTKSLSGTGHFNEGSGIAVTNVDSNPLPDFIFASNDAPSGPNYVRYKIAFNVNSSGDYSSTTSGYYFFEGVGDHQSYSNIAVADINKNGRPDLLFIGDDDPPGPNQLRYKIAFDLNTSGNYTSLGGNVNLIGLGDYAEGVAATLADVDRNGTIDLVLSTNDAPSGPNEFRYIVGFNLNNAGTTSNWR